MIWEGEFLLEPPLGRPISITNLREGSRKHQGSVEAVVNIPNHLARCNHWNFTNPMKLILYTAIFEFSRQTLASIYLCPELNMQRSYDPERRAHGCFSTHSSAICTISTNYTVRHLRSNHPTSSFAFFSSSTKTAPQCRPPSKTNLMFLSILILRRICDSENEVDDDSEEEDNG